MHTLCLSLRNCYEWDKVHVSARTLVYLKLRKSLKSMKPVKKSKIQEWKGLDKIQSLVHSMPSIYREGTKDDFGIDGEIEILKPDESADEPRITGKIIKFQAKSGASYLHKNKDNENIFYADKSDLEYWCACTYPVILIVYNPIDSKLYFKDVKSYLKQHPNFLAIEPHKVVFTEKDEFIRESYSQLCEIARLSPERIAFDKQERLYGNLFPVIGNPTRVYRANCLKSTEEVFNGLNSKPIIPFCIVNRFLYTFSNLLDPENPLRDFCDVNTVRIMALNGDWINRNRSQYAQLLNQVAEFYLINLGFNYDRDLKRFYFPAENNASKESKKKWTSFRTGRKTTRTVCKFYIYGKDSFWKHHAAKISFRWIGESWYLQIVPQYQLTQDGIKRCSDEKTKKYITPIIAREFNYNVLNNIFFWGDILSNGKSNIEIEYQGKILIQVEKIPISVIANFAITDDPAMYEEDETDAISPLLFSLEGLEDRSKPEEEELEIDDGSFIHDELED